VQGSRSDRGDLAKRRSRVGRRLGNAAPAIVNGTLYWARVTPTWAFRPGRRTTSSTSSASAGS